MAEKTPDAAPAPGTALVDPSSEPADRPTEEETARADALVEAELLVEEISIDGMCGVY